LNRITSATDNISRYNLSGMEYDKNGNITNLTRKGHIVDNPVSTNSTDFGTMDVLSYNYETNSNKLIKVTDAILAIPGDGGFKDGNKSGNDFSYDANGNMKTDANKGITAITYNHLNLPTSVTLPGGTILYIYDATGVKQKKIVPGKETQYAGNYIYEKIGTTTELQFFNHPEGYVSYDGGQFNYVYNYTDHLGNVRLSYTDANGNGSIDLSSEIIQENNYYPFGLSHKGYNIVNNGLGNVAAKRYKFGGKELQDELSLDWYDVSARNYDPALGRWMNIDPLAEQMRRHSPYNYAFNNPIIFQDPDGMAPFTDLFDKNGKKVGTDGVDNGVKIVVTDDAKSSEISKIEGNVNLDEVGLSSNNAVVLPDDATLQESLNVLDRQVANGGRKEEASTVVENGRRVKRAETGSEPSITKQEDGTYAATAETNLPETPLLPGEEVTATIHSHPTETIDKDGWVFPFSANTPTAGSDTETFKNSRTNIIVGPISGKVTRGSDGKLIDNRTRGVSIFNNKSQLQISLPANSVKKIIGN